MRSVRSWFNPTLFRKNLTRFWPIWGLYLVIWLFALPINLILDNVGIGDFLDLYLPASIRIFGLPLAVCFGLLAACAVWSYLYNSRSACLMHGLPIRREGLFLTNFLSGFAFFVGPNVAVFALTALAEASRGRVDLGGLALWLVDVTLMELFFFCFATFCAMFTGHMLGLPAFYAIANVLVAGVVWLLTACLDNFVFGYIQPNGMWRFAEWMTPALKLFTGLRLLHVAETDSYQIGGLGYILIYVFFGLVLLGIALAVYLRRDMERAGDVVSVPRMRPVFQYGVAFCCALAFGTFLYAIFYDALPQGAWTLLVFMLLCGAAGYFVARMLLEKSFRVFHCWKGCLPFLAALVALVCVMEFDLLGYERRLPGTADVASVEVQVSTTRPYDSGAYGEIDTEDPQVLEAVLAVHQAIIDNKDAIEGGGVNPEEAAVWTDSAQGLTDSARGWTYVAFQVDYTLQSGKVLSRQYDCEIPVTAWDLDDPDSLSAKLDALMNLPQVRQQLYGLDDYADDQLVGVGLDSWEPNADGGGIETVTLSREASQAVLQAVRADLADGSLGRHYLMDSQERLDNCFVNDLEFTFYLPNLVQTQGDRTYDAQAAATTTIVTVTLQTTAKRTLAALEQAGVLERPARLLTQSQLDQAMDAMWANDDSWDGIDLGDYTWAVFGEEG